MSDPLPPNRLSFDENINALLEELVLAEKWERPSILLAVHKSKFGQNKAQKTLEDRLNKLGQRVSYLVVDEQHSDIPHSILSTPAAEGSVFFVSNIDWGGGQDRKDAYRAINIYRELFVERHLRAVFWLTVNEAAVLPRYAPDFWAFRHRVIEFTGQRIPHTVILPSGVLIWDIQNSVDPFDTLQARISVREELLSKLPRNAEANASRADLLYNLGYLYWLMGNTEKAAQQLLAGLDLVTGEQVDPIRSSLLSGLAILSYEAKDYARAADLCTEALQEYPQSASLTINLTITLCTLGRNQEALALARKAIKLNGRDARVWNALGYVYLAMGKADDAINCFTNAAGFGPRIAAYHVALAICYDIVERPDETRHELALARTLARDQAINFLDIYESALLENPPKSLALARAAVRAGQLSALELWRDPNLNLLMDPAQLKEILA